MIKKLCKSIVLWTFGGTIYFIAEVIWKMVRSRSDSISWTMLILAAIICIPLDQINEQISWEIPLPIQSVICGSGITVVEFITGLILNKWLNLGIWDYSLMSFNFMGQICLQFSILWCAISLVGIILFDWLRYILYGEQKPIYR